MDSPLAKLAHLKIPLEDILKATNNFNPENIIGRGKFGPAYKGKLLRSGKLLEITARRLDTNRGLGYSEFWKEVKMLSDLKHINIVSIIGFCDEKHEKIIITQSEANGSLRRFLNSTNLTWTQRLRICVGVARALSYLHSYDGRDYVVIHRFINSSTILLDENWMPKLSCFEISITQSVHQKGQVIPCEPIGTLGYLDPDVENTGGVTHKSDIYAFGVVLFEILCGRKAFDKLEADQFLAPLAKSHYESQTLSDIIDSDVWNHMSHQSLIKYSKVAYSCLKEERTHRPDSNNLINELEKSLDFQLQRENLVTSSLGLTFESIHNGFGKSFK